MPVDAFSASSAALIAGRYAVDTSQVLTDAGGGIPAYRAHDRLAANGGRVALAVSRHASPRARHLKLLTDPIDDLMAPLGHGVAPLQGGKGEGHFIICTPPPGPAVLAALRPWPERLLLDLVLTPIARVLDGLHSRNLTHRAIRPNNVFQSAWGQPVTLGAAWAAPPAMHQQGAFESPYSVMCHPAGRGEGTPADDIYALGVLLLTLAGGKLPMAGMDDETIIRCKLEHGSFAALTRDISVPSGLADLLRGMLAEDPDHRPPAEALLDTGHLRGRRVGARPARRSQRPLMLGDTAIFDARSLGFALLRDEKRAIQVLRNGLATQWLRRGLGDASMAAQIEELVRGRSSDTRPSARADPFLVMQAIAVINPRMPLCWRGIALWPDALPSLLAEGINGDAALAAAAEEVLTHAIPAAWATGVGDDDRPDAPDISSHRHLLQAGGQGGLLRLFYLLNPLLPCRAPAMSAEWIASLPGLMRFLERTAATAGDSMVDDHVAAFIAARADRKMEIQVSGLTGAKDPETFLLAELALLRDLQTSYHPSPMPGLAKWVASRLRRDINRWRNRPRREALQLRLDALAQAGSLSRLLALAGDKTARALDVAGAQRAANELAMIEAELAAIDHDDQRRIADAARIGQAITSGVGLSAFILISLSILLR